MSLTNVGSTDRIVRIIIGILLIAAPYFTNFTFWDNQTLRILIQVIGGILILTGLFRFCGLYKIIGMNTSK